MLCLNARPAVARPFFSTHGMISIENVSSFSIFLANTAAGCCWPGRGIKFIYYLLYLWQKVDCFPKLNDY